MKIKLSVILGLLFAPALAAFAVQLAETPSAVQQTIHTQVGTGELGDIDQTNQDGEMSFDVSYTTKAGDELNFSVADDGTLLSVEVALNETPAAVQATIRSEATGWELEEIDKNVADAEVSYDVDVSKDGVGKNFTIAADGSLSSRGMTLAETPAAVRKTIENKTGGGHVNSVDEVFDEDGNTFEVAITANGGGASAFTVSTNGTVMSEEVSLQEVSPQARKTIRERLAGGKILQIERSLLEKKDGVLPYEVLGRKSGKPFDFSVGPHGKFLGMDD